MKEIAIAGVLTLLGDMIVPLSALGMTFGGMTIPSPSLMSPF
jgi:hypothetical protein